jgi:nitrate/nitrite transporter NarK
MFLSGLTDAPIAIIGGYAYHRFGVRLSLFVAFLLTLTGGIMILILSEANPDLVPIMISLAKGGAKVSFDICYLANSIIFPAIFAGTAFGLCNIGAKVSTILSPMLAEVEAPIPMIVFSIIALIASVVSLFIK